MFCKRFLKKSHDFPPCSFLLRLCENPRFCFPRAKNRITIEYMKHVVLALVACAALLAGCTTLQQDINIEQHSYSEEVLSFEAVLAQLDADALVSGAADSVAAAQFVQDIDGAIADPAVQKASLARLYALRGRGYLLLGKTGKARDSYEESVKAYKGDSQSLVLGARLGILSLGADSASSGAAAERALIVLEEAVTLYRGRQFTGAVAKFDEAFLSLEPFYRESYAKVRDAAWGFRSLSDAENQGDVMFRNEITVAEMVAIARENSDLLYNYTAGKQLGQHDLFVKISRSGLLDAASGAPSAENALGEGDRAFSNHFTNSHIVSVFIVFTIIRIIVRKFIRSHNHKFRLIHTI